MRAGRLNKRVTIQLNTPTQDSGGGMVDSWGDFATVWAEVKDLSGREFIAAAATNNAVQTKITIRYLAGVLPSMRVVNGSDTYKIESVIGQDGRSLLLMCSRTV